MAGGLENLFRAHWSLVRGYLLRRTGDPTAAEELAQETFYRATRAFLGWRGGSPVAWLLSIARNVLIDEVRRGRMLLPLPETLVDPRAEHEDALSVRAVLAELPAAQRRLLELVYVHGFSHAETAAILGSSDGAVRTGVWRARTAFKRLYEREESAVAPESRGEDRGS
jgi:RNA polymerase sigma-70 factor (ECF subfamily)